MPASDINEVLEQLTAIIDQSKRKEKRTGYFAALYREVTRRVKDGIAAGRFDDPGRMERFDVTFANRYLQAVEHRKNEQPVPDSWRRSFEAARYRSPLILQHLLLGMNAHINLDLGIAADEVTSGEPLDKLKQDFFRISDLLANMIDDVQQKINDLSPWMGCLDRLGGEADEVVSNFCIRVARAEAWQFARDLDQADPDRRLERIEAKDQETKNRVDDILHPGGLLAKPILWAARLREPFDPSYIIQTLSAWS